MEKIIHIVSEFYLNMGVSTPALKMLTAITMVTADLIIMLLSYYFLSKIIEPIIIRLTKKTEVKWDDLVFRHKALRWAWLLLPLMIGKLTLPSSLALYPTAQEASSTMLNIALVLSLMMVVIEAIKSIFMLIGDHDRIDEIAEHMRQAELNGEEFVYRPSHSLKGLQQMLTILVVALGVILCISIIFGKNPLIVISGLGAAAAVLMLVFQDSILGVVAGVQITANDLLEPGDWINSPKYEANGIVQEVTLAAVKVKNWDQTIVTIPPYKLLTEGFQNWKGMQQSKGRRIARSFCIDMTSIRYASSEEITQWSTQKWWRKDTKNESGKIVNLTAFRMYLEHYITTIPTTRHKMLYMVRELHPTPEGLPVEIYFFTSRIDWKGYELVQAEVTDQVIAVMQSFGLRIYQRPSAYDFQNSSKPLPHQSTQIMP